jgi:uncharacterized protein YprB with RNaseH-like and TPR domain
MPSDDLKKRIEALNKQPLHNVPSEMGGLRRKLTKQAESKKQASEPVAAAPTEPVVYSRTAPPPRRTTPKLEDLGPSVALEEAVCGVCKTAPCGPGYYHIELMATELDPCACDSYTCFCPLLGHPAGEAVEQIAAVCKSERIAPEEIVFLDLETTGLSMTPVFLIGTMECCADGFAFHQYFARDYSEEASILSAFSERLKTAKMVVTFNGKSFDVPFLHNRAIATGVTLPHPKTHLDLLHEARRHFGRTTPNHKLQTLEKCICGKCREDDIPGAEIPAAYHEFVRTGNARKISQILTHNLHDLLTMADLMHHMWRR